MYEYDEEDNLVYEGDYDPIQFANFLRRGYGVINKHDISLLEGDRENDLPNGEGNLYNDDGTIFKHGNWENGHNRDDTDYVFRKTKTTLNDILVNFLYISLIIMNVIFIPATFFSDNLAVALLLLISVVLSFVNTIFLSESIGNNTCASFAFSIGLIFYFFIISSLVFEYVKGIVLIIIVVLHFYPFIADLLIYFIRIYN